MDIDILLQGEVKPSPKNALPNKLDQIYQEIKDMAKKYKACAIVAEVLYSHHKHPTTLGILAQVRGVVALLSQHLNLEFFEYSPTKARKSFLGRGNVNSEQVKKMAEKEVKKRVEQKVKKKVKRRAETIVIRRVEKKKK